MEKIAFEIVKRIGVIAENPSGWRKELNIVSWNNGYPKLDIRDWSPSYEKMSRGITLSMEEGRQLYVLLQRAVNDPSYEMNNGSRGLTG